MQTPVSIDNWIQAASANLNISQADRLKASDLLHEFQRLDWWWEYSDDGDVRQREGLRTHNARAQLREFAGASDDHAYLASRIYDETAPEEFARPRPWYVPADPEIMRAIDAKGEDTPSQLRAAWQAPAFSYETIRADPWTAVYLPIPENLPASFGVFTLQDARALVREMRLATVEPNDWEPVQGRFTFDKLALGPLLNPENYTREGNFAAAGARLAELDARLQIEHSRWTDEPLGEAAGVTQIAKQGQSH